MGPFFEGATKSGIQQLNARLLRAGVARMLQESIEPGRPMFSTIFGGSVRQLPLSARQRQNIRKIVFCRFSKPEGSIDYSICGSSLRTV
jgi:hypothetical protein